MWLGSYRPSHVGDFDILAKDSQRTLFSVYRNGDSCLIGWAQSFSHCAAWNKYSKFTNKNSISIEISGLHN